MVLGAIRKMNFRAQASIETLIILAMGLFIITTLVALVYDQMNIDYVAQQQREGTAAATLLVSEINDAYFLGSGTVKEVLLVIPKTVDLNKSFISGNTLVLNVNGTDLIFGTDVNVVGSWPNSDGSYVFVITAFDDFVSVSTQAASFSPAEISQTLMQNTAVDFNVVFTNVSDHVVEYSVISNLSGAASVVYSGVNPFSIESKSSLPLSFSINCDRNSFGSYFGKIIFDSQSVADSNLSLSVRIFCSSAQTKLTIFPTAKSISAVNGVNSSDSVLVCNSSRSTFSNLVAQIDGAITPFVFTSFSGDIDPNTCRTLDLNIVLPSAGQYFGVLYVSAGGFRAQSDIDLNVS